MPQRTISLLAALERDNPSRQTTPDYLLINQDKIRQFREELARHHDIPVRQISKDSMLGAS